MGGGFCCAAKGMVKEKVTVEVEEGGGGCKAVVGAYATTGIGEGVEGCFVGSVEGSRWCEGRPADQEEEAGIQASEGA